MYAAGMLEGYLTVTAILDNLYNLKTYFFGSEGEGLAAMRGSAGRGG